MCVWCGRECVGGESVCVGGVCVKLKHTSCIVHTESNTQQMHTHVTVSVAGQSEYTRIDSETKTLLNNKHCHQQINAR